MNESLIYSRSIPIEFKVIALRECPVPLDEIHCNEALPAVAYWRSHIATAPYYSPDCECLAVLILNTRLRIKGHQMITIGTMDTLLVHPREVFRGAIVAGASKIVLMHNHPSGDPDPSEADIKVTREIARGGQLLKIEVLDHIIVGHEKYVSLRERGYLYT